MSNDEVIDIAVIIVYLVGITAFGLWIGRRKSSTAEDYFLGGRQFNWVLIGFSLFATNIGMGFFIGGTGLATRVGLAALNPELLGGLMLTVSAMIFIPLFIRSRIFTIPQFLELRYNRTAKMLYGGLFAGQQILAMPVSIYMGALAVLGLFGLEVTAANIYLVGALIACTVGTYAIMGGLTSVVITDFVQVLVMIAGSLVVAIVSFMKIGGWGELYRQAGPEMFTLLRPHSDETFPWSAVLTGQLLHSAFYAFCSIQILQRALGAKDVRNAQMGMLLGGGLKLFGIVLFIIPGIIGSILYPDIPGDLVYTQMVRDFLVPGFRGLVLAGMLAAMMSSQDSSINALGSVVALDTYPIFRKGASQNEAVLVGKVFSVYLAAVVCLYLFFF